MISGQFPVACCVALRFAYVNFLHFRKLLGYLVLRESIVDMLKSLSM